MKNTLYYGAAYYPELWSKEVIAEDIRMMKETGINVVRMAEFAWATMEPEIDRIDVGFFKDCINTLYENGIDTVLCTPTPTPPIWLTYDHPERLHVDATRAIKIHGARQHVCTNHPFMRERSRIIIEEMAKELGSLPGVIAWQTDNEFKCHVEECFCETCAERWHQWLEKRYRTIDALNNAWGTAIWSQRYQQFDQVPQPFITTYHHNASLSTMYRIFSREMIVEFQKEQTDIIRAYSEAAITHNTHLWFKLNQEALFEDLDFFSFDAYDTHDQYKTMLMMYDMGRGVQKERRFWVMETSPSHNGALNNVSKTHPDGYLTAESVAAYALGAQGFSYWLWRQQRSGCEQPHGSILSAWGKPTVGYPNVLKAAAARTELEDLICSTQICPASVALTYSDSASIFFYTEPLENLQYMELFNHYYRILSDAGIFRDIIFEGANVEGYKLVLSPYMPLLTDDYLDKLQSFVEEGGIWIVGPITGGRTAEHTVHTNHGLGKLDELAGVETLYTVSLSGTDTEGEAFGLKAPLGHWSALFQCREAVPKGVIHGNISEGAVFISERILGKGKIVLIGSSPLGEQGEQMMKLIFKHYADEQGICEKVKVTPGTIAVMRQATMMPEYCIAINMDGAGGKIYTDTQEYEVEPYGYRVIRLPLLPISDRQKPILPDRSKPE